MDRAVAFHEAKWRMYKRRQNDDKAKHHAARARYYRAAFGTGPGDSILGSIRWMTPTQITSCV